MRNYTAEPTAARFHNDHTSSVKALMSAVGQGKSVASIMEMMQISGRQAPDEHGVRYSRWCIVRSSYSQLKSTTIRTFQEWLPQHYCPIVYDSPIRGLIDKDPLPDGTFLHIEFIFMSMDGPTSESDLASLEVTGFWINEAAEFRNPKILNDVFRRTGRYPAAITAPLTWSGVIMDYNPPAKRSWLHDLFEKNPVTGRTLYKIPAPLIAIRDEEDPDDNFKVRFVANPLGEGVQHQPKKLKYWLEIADQDRADWEKITRFVLGDYTHGVEGQPVFPAFNPRIHVSTAPLTPRRGSMLLVGMDWGLTPAALFCQYFDGRINVLSEITTTDCDIVTFCEDLVVPHVRERYAGMQILAIGDPAGVGRSQIDKRTPFMVLHEFGIAFTRPSSNAWAVRKAAVNWFLQRRQTVLVDEQSCPDFTTGMSGGYHLETPRNQHAIQSMLPVKDFYSHIADCFQGVCQYAREGGELYSGLPGEQGFSLTEPGQVYQNAQPEQSFMFV